MPVTVRQRSRVAALEASALPAPLPFDLRCLTRQQLEFLVYLPKSLSEAEEAQAVEIMTQAFEAVGTVPMPRPAKLLEIAHAVSGTRHDTRCIHIDLEDGDE